MSEVNIPPGGSRDGWIWLSVNGVEQWIKTGVATDLDSSEIEVLANAGITYNILASGDFTNIVNAADGVYSLNGETCAITDIIDLAHPWAAFDPILDIDVDGIKARATEFGSSGRLLPLKDPLLATMLADGFTIVYDIYINLNGSVSITTINDDESEYGEQSAIYQNDGGPLTNKILLADYTQEQSLQVAAGLVEDAINRVAFTITDAKVVASVNGGVVRTLAFPALTANSSSIIIGSGANLDTRLRSFVLYAPADDADLPGLSTL